VSLLQPIIIGGELKAELPTLSVIRAEHRRQLELFPPEVLRKVNPQPFPVVLSDAVWEQKKRLIEQYGPHQQ
jgi:hypothetical protein